MAYSLQSKIIVAIFALNKAVFRCIMIFLTQIIAKVIFEFSSFN